MQQKQFASNKTENNMDSDQKNPSQNSFRGFSDSSLIAHLQKLVSTERRTTAEILEVLKEVDARRLYLQLGFTSLFAYLTDGLSYSPAAAQRRIDSARLLRAVPEIKADLESGELNLTQVSMLAQGLRQKKASQASPQVAVSEIKSILTQIKNQNPRATQQTIAQELDLPLKAVEIARAQKDNSTRLEVTLPEDEMAKLQRSKEIISHTHPNPSWAELVCYLNEEFLKRKDPLRARKNQSSKKEVHPKATDQNSASRGPDTTASPTNTTAPSQSSNAESARRCDPSSKTTAAAEAAPRPHTAVTISNPRRMTVSIRHLVFQSHQSCQWINPLTGEHCGSRFQLQVDHKHPVWAGGTSELANLQLLCSVHNAYKYRREAGLH